MITRASDDSVLLAVRVKPRPPRTHLGRERAGRLLVEVTAPPLDGRANETVCRLIARALSAPATHVGVVAGERGRDKLIRIDGVASADVATRLGLPEL